jgi:hypothetical protein
MTFPFNLAECLIFSLRLPSYINFIPFLFLARAHSLEAAITNWHSYCGGKFILESKTTIYFSFQQKNHICMPFYICISF